MEKDEIDILIKRFNAVESIRQLAACLNVEYKILKFHLYLNPEAKRYKEFEIKKRKGGVRKITAPISGVKIIQEKLNLILQNFYPQKSSVHGFVLNKNIKTNAARHVGKRYLINIDIKDFFPTINFGRVRGLFMSHPFYFNADVATALAQICCFKNALPQGAPTSPIVSNYICRRLDNNLLELTAGNRCTYSRYADDITISTNMKSIPSEIGIIKANKLVLSSSLKLIFKNNGFIINKEKVRYATRTNRQEVTGLVVNEFTNVNRKYVRHVRAMIRAWEKFGITLAAVEHFSKYNHKQKKPNSLEASFKRELLGKLGFIGFIKGKDNSLYKNLLARVIKRDPEVRLKIVQNEIEAASNPIIYGEGRTDWKHLKKAFDRLKMQGQYFNQFLQFHEYSVDLEMNNDQLLDICKSLPKTVLPDKITICLFDRDDSRYSKQVVEDGKNYKHWGSGVFSVLMPVPPHRSFDQICIEHYYPDSELKRIDSNGRRIFLSDEFDKLTGKHLSEDLTFIDKKSKNLGYLKANYPRIVDNFVYDPSQKNVALSKNDFAINIFSDTSGFDDFTFAHFKLIFDPIIEIINNHKLPTK